jgi:hypothetical protein
MHEHASIIRRRSSETGIKVQGVMIYELIASSSNNRYNSSSTMYSILKEAETVTLAH